MADSKKYDGSQWEHSLRKMTTATAEIEPTIYTDGTAITAYTLKGNEEHTGTPSPSNPVMLNGVGERTENLCDESNIQNGYYGASTNYSVFTSNSNYRAFSMALSQGTYTIFITADESIRILRCSNDIDGNVDVQITDTPYTFTLSQDTTIYVSWRNADTTDSFTNMQVMLNSGSTAKTYEPYGYKIPISSGQQSIDIYIGDLPLLKSLDGTAVDEISNGTLTRRVDSDGSVLPTPTTTQITMPSISTTEGANTITVDTTVQPSEFSATWSGWHDSSVKEYDGSDWQ